MLRELLKDLQYEESVKEEDLEAVKEKLLIFMLETLSLREYNLVCMRYNLDGKYEGKKRSYKELAELFCYPTVLIDSSIKKALSKLKVEGIRNVIES